jgi:hypothetical protein
LGYKIAVKVPLDLRLNHWKEESITQGVVAFADDTTWIAPSKKNLVRILEIAEEFFKINDIQINSNKSKLIVINAKKRNESQIEI